MGAAKKSLIFHVALLQSIDKTGRGSPVGFIAEALQGFSEVPSSRCCDGSVSLSHEGRCSYQMFVIGQARGAGKQTGFSW